MKGRKKVMSDFSQLEPILQFLIVGGIFLVFVVFVCIVWTIVIAIKEAHENNIDKRIEEFLKKSVKIEDGKIKIKTIDEQYVEFMLKLDEQIKQTKGK